MSRKFFLIALLAVGILSAVVFGPLAVRATEPSQPLTTEQILAKIAELQAQIEELKKQLTQNSSSTVWCHTFNKNLQIGNKGDEILALRTALSKEGILEGIVSGVSDIPVEFDEQTASVIVEFQEKYTDEILKPSGLKRGTGYVGPSTRAKLNKLFGCVQINKDNIAVTSPKNNALVSSPLVVEGKVKGWFFEGTFPVALYNSNGVLVTSTVARPVSGDWMTADWNPFRAVLDFSTTSIQGFSSGYIILRNDNPSGLAQYDKQKKIPVVFGKKKIEVTFPNKPEALLKGATYTITWLSQNIDKVNISLCGQQYKCNEDTTSSLGSVTSTSKCISNDDSCTLLKEGTPAKDGKYTWYIHKGISIGSGYKIRINEVSPSSISITKDESDNSFSIVSSATTTSCPVPTADIKGGVYYNAWVSSSVHPPIGWQKEYPTFKSFLDMLLNCQQITKDEYNSQCSYYNLNCSATSLGEIESGLANIASQIQEIMRQLGR